ncbi:bifunctional diaminohydroxyphosphoribosylaminopyrimidine deaminase/5-amino-6-(5-phosphoribosylamino)uracil reductase RibD [Adlercreutzia sp. ZJ304]|uniref:bifunctional diaminohydroxyphosphoribosylaminopyrimidine deaminase/5-amino-6-(5-phosphoribosylamino)uracil reductase RibD n=1 Tax=Adlercreutzia sp. ZJ304 TaxID=2709791 RepID=UPI0013E9C3CE|nr:bifunctional diaminohydroxyphosphoribosylaminopyrimidine deaminase/5-amino-6-(5-phosphoribosylamino)uracil reductase RibD [Adlercreutzia sp. ZJ304]
MADQKYMLLAIELAAHGRGWVNPNPQVGCVIVKDNRIIGQGWHTKFGALHAEREALLSCKRAGEDTLGATAYVTLEPCCHTGKQPPCCDALIEAGISRVVVGSSDPNPLVAGRGIARLRSAGIKVDEGVLRSECDALNMPFFHFVTTGKPLVIAKFATTLDGKIATLTGESKWITGVEARARVHTDRARYAAVMVGVNTVLADNPMLNARGAGNNAHQPTRVVCDTRLRTPINSNIVSSANSISTVIATCNEDALLHEQYKQFGCTILNVSQNREGHICLDDLLCKLGKMNLDSVIVEGGSTLMGAMFDGGYVDRVQAYIAPKIFGGSLAPSPVGGTGCILPADATELKNISVSSLGCDILIEGDVVSNRHQTQN